MAKRGREGGSIIDWEVTRRYLPEGGKYSISWLEWWFHGGIQKNSLSCTFKICLFYFFYAKLKNINWSRVDWLFLFLINFYCSIVDLQCCVNFRYIAKRVSYTHTHTHTHTRKRKSQSVSPSVVSDFLPTPWTAARRAPLSMEFSKRHPTACVMLVPRSQITGRTHAPCIGSTES